MKFTQRTRGIVQGDRRRPIGGGTRDVRDLRGRRPAGRRRQFGFPRIANLFRAADHFHRAERGAADEPHHDPAGQPRHGRTCGRGCGRQGRLLQQARHGHARRPRRRLPRRRPARHAVRRRDVLRPRRLVVDHRPRPADRPDPHRGQAGDVVVAAPSLPATPRPMPARHPEPPSAPADR